MLLTFFLLLLSRHAFSVTFSARMAVSSAVVMVLPCPTLTPASDATLTFVSPPVPLTPPALTESISTFSVSLCSAAMVAFFAVMPEALPMETFVSCAISTEASQTAPETTPPAPAMACAYAL